MSTALYWSRYWLSTYGPQAAFLVPMGTVGRSKTSYQSVPVPCRRRLWTFINWSWQDKEEQRKTRRSVDDFPLRGKPSVDTHEILSPNTTHSNFMSIFNANLLFIFWVIVIVLVYWMSILSELEVFKLLALSNLQSNNLSLMCVDSTVNLWL